LPLVEPSELRTVNGVGSPELQQIKSFVQGAVYSRVKIAETNDSQSAISSAATTQTGLEHHCRCCTQTHRTPEKSRSPPWRPLGEILDGSYSLSCMRTSVRSSIEGRLGQFVPLDGRGSGTRRSGRLTNVEADKGPVDGARYASIVIYRLRLS
jgi:hypothetical protein